MIRFDLRYLATWMGRLVRLRQPTIFGEFEVEEGAIHVNHIILRHATQQSLLFSIDCVQKRPGYDVQYDSDSGLLEIDLYVEEGDDGTGPTLKVDASPDERGHYARTRIVLSGLQGDWHVTHDWGKYGPSIGLLKNLGDEPVPVFERARK